MTVLVEIDALDAAGAAETLRFSDGKYIDGGGHYYDPSITDAPQISVIANDGGLFGLFSGSSIGDVAMDNIDGHLYYLADYAVDGRPVRIYWHDGATATLRFTGSIGRLAPGNGQMVLSLKAPQEVLGDKHPMAVYAGDNAPPAGLEGTADTLKGKQKPKVFGPCKNISADLVNEPLLIYQVSSRTDCVVTAVFDDGVRLACYLVNGIHAIGATIISVIPGAGDIPTGAKVSFGNHDTLYTVQTGLSAGSFVLASPLVKALPHKTPVDVVNFYASAAALQATDYFVNGDHDKGGTTVNVNAGVGAINAGDQVVFSSHLTVYTVQTALSAGSFTITDGLVQDLGDGDVVHVIGATTPVLWGGYQGYFRLTAKPYGAVTCHAMSVDAGGAIHQAGEVFNLVAAEAGLSVDAGGIAEFNGAGTIGLFASGTPTTAELLARITQSVAGYYHFIGATLFLNLLSAPAATADFTIEDYQIASLEVSAYGMGNNGNLLHGIHCRFDRIETVQQAIDGNVPGAWRQRLKSQYREITTTDAVVKARHLLSYLLELESLLAFDYQVNGLINRVLPVVKARRDVLAITLPRAETPTLLIGGTGKVVSARHGYAAGRNVVVVGYKIDDKAGQVTIYCYG